MFLSLPDGFFIIADFLCEISLKMSSARPTPEESATVQFPSRIRLAFAIERFRFSPSSVSKTKLGLDVNVLNIDDQSIWQARFIASNSHLSSWWFGRKESAIVTYVDTDYIKSAYDIKCLLACKSSRCNCHPNRYCISIWETFQKWLIILCRSRHYMHSTVHE